MPGATIPNQNTTPVVGLTRPVPDLHAPVPQPVASMAPTDQRGLAVIVIDALSYPALQKALSQGLMPNVQKLLEVQGHVARPFMAGVPCTTPASLVGFSYGFNDLIPGFLWLDKASGKWYSASDYKTFNLGFENGGAQHGGPGLWTKGSVQSSIVGGGSQDTHMVLNTLAQKYQQGGNHAAIEYLAPDFGDLLRHPVQAAKSLFWFPVEIVRDIVDDANDASGIRLPWKKVLAKGAEVATENVLMADEATLRIKEEMRRGVPVMFADMAGYDLASHHHGPYAPQSMRHLNHIDKKIGEIYREANKDGHRKYELVLISDHGQTPGRDYKAIYGENFGTWVDHQVQPIDPQEHIACASSGSLNHLYFTSTKQQMQLTDILQKYPNLLDQLVQNPGVDYVAARQNGSTIIVGKNGMMHVTGQQSTTYGADILTPRGEPTAMAAQIAHVTQMPNAGDLVVFGHYDGQQVVTFAEDQDALGGHGGLGGDQDTPMIITEPGRQIDVSKVVNTEQMYPILRSFLPADADPGRPAPAKTP